MTASKRKYHASLGVDLWPNRGAWFWQLAGRCCGARTIGSALTENEALREAHAAVAELSARCARTAPGQVSPAPTTAVSQCEYNLPDNVAAGAADSATKLGPERGEC
jgi:hypothetical protein